MKDRDRFGPIDLEGLKTYSLEGRNSKFSSDQFASPHREGSSFGEFMAGLPDTLAARDLKEVARGICDAHRAGRTVALAMGAHVIKTGLSPVVIDLMKRGILSAVAMNGAGVVHDVEIAMGGATSEDVAASLADGSFGMARETAEFVNGGISRGAGRGLGIGESLGAALEKGGFPYTDRSILACGASLGIPVTVHVAVGTDIVHMHASADGAGIGEGTMIDFRRFCSVVASLEGGVFLNFGSAVVLPEVFLKALTVARNLGHRVSDFIAANFDFIRHYRPLTNVVARPTSEGGRGYAITGHHEIMIPLLAATVLESLAERE